MVSFDELKKGVKIILNGHPYEIIEANFLFKGRGGSVLQAKIKNLLTGNILNYTFHPSDNFEEAEIKKIKAKFLYTRARQSRAKGGNEATASLTSHTRAAAKGGKEGLPSLTKDKFFFSEENQQKRFELTEEQIGLVTKFLKANQIVEGIIFKEKIISIALPIKINLKVIAAPPGVKGDRSQSGTKQVTLETGAKINAPLFIKEGDIVEVNTETGEYVRRVEEH